MKNAIEKKKKKFAERLVPAEDRRDGPDPHQRLTDQAWGAFVSLTDVASERDLGESWRLFRRGWEAAELRRYLTSTDEWCDEW